MKYELILLIMLPLQIYLLRMKLLMVDSLSLMSFIISLYYKLF
jgi:hypothetical protein